jgi:Short repeat of unknown function (DUF308)
MMRDREDPDLQLQRLRQRMNDLIGILAIRPAEMGQDPLDTLTTLLDVLVAALRLDFACGRLDESIVDAPQTFTLGIVSIIAGVLALMNPPVTLAAIMGLIAGFAIVSGVVLLIGAFRLTSAKHQVTDAMHSARA